MTFGLRVPESQGWSRVVGLAPPLKEGFVQPEDHRVVSLATVAEGKIVFNGRRTTCLVLDERSMTPTLRVPGFTEAALRNGVLLGWGKLPRTGDHGALKVRALDGQFAWRRVLTWVRGSRGG